jgi:hypothetical protein
MSDRFADLPSTGSVFSGGSAGNDTVAGWLGLDLAGPLLALAAAVYALVRLPRLAPAAVAFLVLVAAVVRPGHLQPTLATLLLPFAALLVAGAAVATWKYPSWEALLLLVGAPAIAVAVTAGHPVRMLDPKWRMSEDAVTPELEAEADRYAFRAVVTVAVSVLLLMVTFGW